MHEWKIIIKKIEKKEGNRSREEKKEDRKSIYYFYLLQQNHHFFLTCCISLSAIGCLGPNLRYKTVLVGFSYQLQVSRLIYNNAGNCILALGSNAIHVVWKWSQNDDDLSTSGKVKRRYKCSYELIIYLKLHVYLQT